MASAADVESYEHRQAECLRKRKYRATKRSERKMLEAEVRYYEDQLAKAAAIASTSNQRHDAHHDSHEKWKPAAAQRFHERLVAYRQNLALHTTRRCQLHLVRSIQAWIAAQQPPLRAMATQASWLRATLVADPVTRRLGYEWLSDRIYHAAVHARKFHRPFGASVQDAAILALHTCESGDDGGTTIAAMETHSQHTFLHNHRDVADALRACIIEGRKSANYSTQLVEVLDGGFIMYEHTKSHRLGTSLRNVVRFYPSSNHVIVTYCSVLEDETHPLEEGELRPHGFAWVIVDKVTDSITMFRDSRLQQSPVTTRGAITLADHGRIFGQLSGSADAMPSRDTLIERIHTAAEANYKVMQDIMVDDLRCRLDAMSVRGGLDSIA